MDALKMQEYLTSARPFAMIKSKEAGKMKIPENIKHVLARLSGAGYEACLVGGCVRDYYMEMCIRDRLNTLAIEVAQAAPAERSSGKPNRP